MALKSTIYKAALSIADIDHGYYADHALTLARHPSETDERMMVRVVGLALHAHQLQAMLGGDGTLGFGAGLADTDEPDVMLKDFTGAIRLWIEVGQPEERPVLKACGRADQVVVMPYAHSTDLWWKAIGPKLARARNLTVLRLEAAHSKALATLAERSMALQATVHEGVLTLSSERGSVALEPVRLNG